MKPKHNFALGDRVRLAGDKNQRPWRVLGFPAHGTTILIGREGRVTSPMAQAYADPADLRRLPEKDTPS